MSGRPDFLTAETQLSWSQLSYIQLMQRRGPGPQSPYPPVGIALSETTIAPRQLCAGLMMRPIIVDTTWQRDRVRACLIIGAAPVEPTLLLVAAIDRGEGFIAHSLSYHHQVEAVIALGQRMRTRLATGGWQAVDQRPPLSVARFFAALR